MTEQEMQGLLSLSLISYIGPKPDVDYLTAKGFYRKKKCSGQLLLNHISVRDKCYQNYSTLFREFLEDFAIIDKNSFNAKVMELINGSLFGINMEKLMTYAQLLLETGHTGRRISVNGHSYPREMMTAIARYQFHWPDKGFMAYDLANAIMILRLGFKLDYISQEGQLDYLEQILYKVESEYKEYKTFGQDASIGRHIHYLYMDLVRGKNLYGYQNRAQAIAYYSLWQYLIKEKVFLS